jgi:hypothetical protein
MLTAAPNRSLPQPRHDNERCFILVRGFSGLLYCQCPRAAGRALDFSVCDLGNNYDYCAHKGT